MKEEELLCTLALMRTPGIGEITAKKLLRHCIYAEAIFQEKKHLLEKIEGIGRTKIDALFETQNLIGAERELHYILSNNIQFFHISQEAYPQRLRYCIDSPLLLFYKGNIDLNKPKIISIVGTRNATLYGKAFCEKLISDLAIFNPIIVSGFAYGIDIQAHKTALEYNLQTVACLAHGLNIVYPKAHEKYCKDIEAKGGFITDFCSDATFYRNNFLKRNRIIAGLSEATIVIESAEKGGSLVTADIANSYNREVFAVPGKTTDEMSRGCLNLIKHQEAHIITEAADLIYLLNWKLDDTIKPIQKKLFVELSPDEQKIYDFLKKQGKTLLDYIALSCNIPIHKTSSTLLEMELKGVIRPLPGKLFEIT